MVYRGIYSVWASQVVLVVKKNLPANAGDIRNAGFIPGSERFPGEGHGNPLQYSCLKNLMDRRAWKTMVPCIAVSRTRLRQLSTHKGIFCFNKICSFLPLIPYLPLAIQHTDSMILLSVQEDTEKLSTGDCF